MKFVKPVFLLVALSAILMLTACRTGPVYNVQNAPIPTPAASPLSMQQIETAIIQAGSGLGWVMQSVKPGLIQGTLDVRSHEAVVDITYDQKDYSITYKNSHNLKYDGTNIHSQYNNWVIYLRKAINNELAMAR